VNFQTVSFGREASQSERGDVDRIVLGRGGTVEWRTGSRAGRTYGLVALPSGSVESAIGEATVHETAIIALAVFPAVAEALPYLFDALAGAGRPAGILGCARCSGGVVVEWDPQRTPVRTVMDLIDVELRRFGGARTAESLAPLPPDVAARIASEGLQSPEIAPDRELETLLERASLGDA
jgi:hypothetical protein